MGILVCYDDFTYDVVTDVAFERGEGKVAGYDASCNWEKVVIEELPQVPQAEARALPKTC